MIYLLWFASIIVAMAVAGSKGRSVFGWLLLSVCFGPLAALVVICLPKDQESIDLAKMESGESRKCRYCAEMIKQEAIICRYCGKEQRQAAKPEIDITPNKIPSLEEVIRAQANK